MEKGCKKKATNNNRKIQIAVVICMGMLGNLIQKRLQKKGPKSQILVLFDVSKHRKHNAKLEIHWGASAIRKRKICDRGR